MEGIKGAPYTYLPKLPLNRYFPLSPEMECQLLNFLRKKLWSLVVVGGRLMVQHRS